VRAPTWGGRGARGRVEEWVDTAQGVVQAGSKGDRPLDLQCNMVREIPASGILRSNS